MFGTEQHFEERKAQADLSEILDELDFIDRTETAAGRDFLAVPRYQALRERAISTAAAIRSLRRIMGIPIL